MGDSAPLKLVPGKPYEYDIRWPGPDGKYSDDGDLDDDGTEPDREANGDGTDKSGDDAVKDESANKEGEDGGLGSKCEVRRLYNHSTGRAPQWSLHEDPILEEQRLKALSEPFAVIHRFEKGDVDKWATSSIEVQSPRLKAILNTVFEGYRNWHTDKDPYTFRPPFRQFFHRWDRLLLSLRQQTTDEETNELKLFIEELVPLVTPYVVALEEFRATRLINFRDLWLIFPPDELIVAEIKGSTCAAKLRSINYCSTPIGLPDTLLLEAEQMDWNGSYCGYQTVCLVIREFSAPTLVTKLDVCPLKFAMNEQDVRMKLIRRGRLFAKYRGFHTMRCKGTKYTFRESHGDVETVAKPLSGRVIIDAYAFYNLQSKIPPELRKETDTTEADIVAGLAEELAPDTLNCRGPLSEERDEEIRALTDLECLLATPRVRGFDLQAKEWCEFDIDKIQEPGWNTTAYDKLVLPGREKDLIMAFCNPKRLSKTTFDDIIQLKGRGIIILLCGRPGVGKTLTAEAAAEKHKLPLYVLGANDLGSTAEKADAALETAFKCCQLWNALLLMDEADVFLETRDSHHLERNELVAVFLRRLEYYQGLMFLTTNRTTAIDGAFKSRMDLILRYADLDLEARKAVWENFLDLLPQDAIDRSKIDIDELARDELNGREIKNLIKTANVLGSEEGKLTMEHLRVVLEIRKRLGNLA